VAEEVGERLFVHTRFHYQTPQVWASVTTGNLRRHNQLFDHPASPKRNLSLQR
jgi:hypothetical protein